jgi:predicted aldo/keto reductase-like oxidoreductase
MRYQRFGKTNLNLSVFSLGTMRYLASEENALHTVKKALSLGINHIETAKGYGQSEEYLGRILTAGLSIDRSNIHITTKIPPTPSAESMQRQIEDSLKLLKLDYIDFLAIHGINTSEHLAWIQSETGCMQAVKTALDQGKIRHIGFSTHAPLEIILATINTDLFEFINLHYYYFFQRNFAAIELAKEKDMGVFIISPSDKGGQLYTPSETLKKLCQPFTPLELNYRFLLSNRKITTLSIGPANPKEIEGLEKIADQIDPLTPEEIATFENLTNHANTILNTDKCSQCYACLPCPELINIPEVLRLRNLAVAYQMIDFGKYRYQMFENAGHWFPGNKGNRCTNCEECLPRCPEKLDIPTLLRDTHDRLNGKSRRRLWG